MLASPDVTPPAVRNDPCADRVPDLDQRLRLIEGQVGGLRRMVSDHRACDEVLTQLLSVARALDAVRIRLLAAHVCTAEEPDGVSADRLAVLERLLRTTR